MVVSIHLVWQALTLAHQKGCDLIQTFTHSFTFIHYIRSFHTCNSPLQTPAARPTARITFTTRAPFPMSHCARCMGGPGTAHGTRDGRLEDATQRATRGAWVDGTHVYE